MLSASQFRRLVSGQWQGPLAAVLRSALGVAERPYGWAVQRRNARFDRGAVQPARFDAPLISVGNLTVGGTGKTPFVCWLAKWFLARGMPVTLISRGYGGQNGRPNDEALELAARLPGVPHLQNPDRVAAARQALAANPRQALVLDDAFQHRRIARDLDIVLLDALEPFGYDRLLPRGLLREPVSGLARAQVVALSRADAVSELRRREIEARVRSLAPQAIWLELTHQPTGLVSHAGGIEDLTAWRGRQVAAFCGIGNPAGFRHTLASCGLTMSEFRELPDHYAYPPAAVNELSAWAKNALAAGAEAVICTRKDLVKLPHESLAGLPLFALDVRLQILAGQDRLEVLLAELVARNLGGPTL
jgi:tetraacyldisaccharide 4'-kinase